MIEIMSDLWLRSFEGARIRDLDEGETLFWRDDPVANVFVVKAGRVVLQRALKDGGLLVIHSALVGDLVAEASMFADRYHCDAVASVASTVAYIDRDSLLSRIENEAHSPSLAVDAFRHTARELQQLRTRLEIMRLRKVADRLDAYLDLFGAPNTGAWVGVADWIGVSPPALYRELAKRRLKNFP